MVNDTLIALGWDADRDNEFSEHRERGLVPARVSVQHRGAYDVIAETGDLRCEVTRRMVKDAPSPADLPAVGDWVAVEPGDDGRGTIHAVLDRRSRFSRLAAHDAGSVATREQVVAANVDVVFVVSSVNEDLSVRRLERYLTLAWESGARPVVLLTKADLVGDVAAIVDEVAAVTVGVTVHAVSVRDRTGIDDVISEIPSGTTAALLGSSGVGKSTLVNTLLGEDVLATQSVREDGKGRHTTTRRELIRLPHGGLVIDTPGMRELQLWVADDGLDEAFGDVTDLFADCRFADCSHDVEPGCAVLAALENGTLAPERWTSYRKLQRELEALERRLDKQAQSQERKRWRALSRESRARQREKGRG